MSISYSKKIDTNQYTEFVPKFLKILAKYGYSQAQLKSTVEVKKDNEVNTYKDLSVKEILEVLSKDNFIKCEIMPSPMWEYNLLV